jgi:hypothetical protein
MKPTLTLTALAILLIVAPSSCFALWGISSVTKTEAKKLGMEIRSAPAGPNHVSVEMDFPADGELKGFSRVDLRLGLQDNPPLTAPLREDRSKPGRVVVSFIANRDQLDKIALWVFVPGDLGGTIYDVRVKDFVEAKKAP